MSTFGPFGGFVRNRREICGISVRKLAKTVGISPTYLSHVEIGRVPPPSWEKVQLIALALRLDPLELITYAGKLPEYVALIVETGDARFAVLIRHVLDLDTREFDQLIQKAIDLKSDRPLKSLAFRGGDFARTQVTKANQ